MTRMLRTMAPGLLATLVAVAVAPAPLSAENLSQIFGLVNPSVVIVRTSEREVCAEGQLAKFGEVGSGVLISSDGKVMTAAHVVHLADRVVVEFLGGERVDARIVASDADADVSLLQLDRVPAHALVAAMGDSDRVQIGEQVFIIGAPYGIGHTLSAGHISGRHEPDTVYHGLAKAEFLQTDAAINQGNSGGPMFNMKGEVIGIVSHIISKSGGFEGLGFVVTANMAKRMMLETRPFWSGVTWFKVSGELAEYLNLPQPFGLAVEEVAKNSPAEAIGLRASRVIARIEGRDVPLGGDIVLASMGITLESEESFHKVRERQAQLRSGDELTYRVFRAGKVIELKGRLP